MASIGSAESMQSWWESISKARARILALSSLLPSSPLSTFSFSILADSDRPAVSFLSSLQAYELFSSALSTPSSGSGSDPLCQWLYETYLSSDSQLQLIVLSFVPLISGVYLGRLHSFDSSSTPLLAGFEAVLLAIYTSEVKARGGKPILVNIPDLSQHSLYHTPKTTANNQRECPTPSVGVLSPPLEPQTAVKSTKRPAIIGVALDCYFKQISQMPSWSKTELCRFATGWAGQDCACKDSLDHAESKAGSALESMGSSGRSEIEELGDEVSEKIKVEEGGSDELRSLAVRIPLPWEMLQPLVRILGHCLLAPLNGEEVKDAASVAVRRLYGRASHDLEPQAILATRSLVQLDNRARESAKVSAIASVSSDVNTPTKVKKPEILLSSK